LLRALDVDAAQIPGHLDEADALFRALTAGRRLLPVLDNARDATQVRPLLPAGPFVEWERLGFAALAVGQEAAPGGRGFSPPVRPRVDAREAREVAGLAFSQLCR